jgi:hypothetical protein
MPTGPIVGGVIGGIALIAFISFLVSFCLQKQRQDKAIAIALLKTSNSNNNKRMQ